MDAIVQFIDNPEGYYSLARYFTHNGLFNVFAFAVLGLVMVVLGGGVVVRSKKQVNPQRSKLTGILLTAGGTLSLVLTVYSYYWNDRMTYSSWPTEIFDEVQAGRAPRMFIFAGLGLVFALAVVIPGIVILVRGEKHKLWSGRTTNYNGRMLLGLGLLLLLYPITMGGAGVERLDLTTQGWSTGPDLPTVLLALLQLASILILASCIYSCIKQRIELRRDTRAMLRMIDPDLLVVSESSAEEFAILMASKDLSK